MRKLDRLIREARTACTARDHLMNRFVHAPSGERAYSECADCGKWVRVDTQPLPNDIEIGGPAVALDCERPMRKLADKLQKLGLLPEP